MEMNNNSDNFISEGSKESESNFLFLDEQDQGDIHFLEIQHSWKPVKNVSKYGLTKGHQSILILWFINKFSFFIIQ